jgi:hypothetical protein
MQTTALKSNQKVIFYKTINSCISNYDKVQILKIGDQKILILVLFKGAQVCVFLLLGFS